MSRGGRGGARGGRGGGRGGFAAAALPMGLTFADLQNLSRDATELYPTFEPLPALSEISEKEQKIAELQLGVASRMRQSKYYLVEHTKSTDLPRYSDKYRPSASSQPTLKRKDLHAPFFPKGLYEDYFNPKLKRKETKSNAKKRIDLDGLEEDVDEEKSDDEKSAVGSEAEASDYDVDEEYDNDYAENYFDNGEGDDMDDLGGGGGGDEGGGGDYD